MSQYLKQQKIALKINKTKPSTLEFVDKNTLKQIKFNFSKKAKCCIVYRV